VTAANASADQQPAAPARRRRVLVFAETVTLAHAVRPVLLAEALPEDEFEVLLAWAPRYAKLFPGLRLATMPIASLSTEAFAEALAAGRPIYSREQLEAYVAADLAAIADFRPDAIVGDFRISLSVSARLAGVPYVAISNAYWSPWARRRIPVPDLPVTRWLGAAVAQFIFDRVRPYAFASHARPLEQVRRAHGLSGFGGSLERAYTDADVTLYADMPGLVELVDAPVGHRVLGPLLWSPPGSLPAWWEELDASRPIVYVTLGSSGDPRTLPAMLSVLGEFEVTVLLATAGKPLGFSPPANVRMADFLPGIEACQRASLTLCNGGSPTTQQALVAGRPVLGICTNLDQLLNMVGVVRAGAGLSLRVSEATPERIRAAVNALLHEPGYTAAAQRLAQRCSGLDVQGDFAATLRSLAPI
jgi:UDP:flavonoid glycosyltransferase YjiC (YdhE family)